MQQETILTLTSNLQISQPREIQSALGANIADAKIEQLSIERSGPSDTPTDPCDDLARWESEGGAVPAHVMEMNR